MLRALSDLELNACRYPTTGAAASPLRQLNARQARLYGRTSPRQRLAYAFLTLTLLLAGAALYVAHTQHQASHYTMRAVLYSTTPSNAGRDIHSIL